MVLVTAIHAEQFSERIQSLILSHPPPATRALVPAMHFDSDDYRASPLDIARMLPPLARLDSHASISTTATAPNLPGPGRTVGLLFGFLGRHLESQINGISRATSSGPATEPANAASSSGSSHHPLVRTDSISSISTNATAANLPGPGRTVGLAFDALGRRLESFANKNAVRRGLGPESVAQNLRLLRRHNKKSIPERHSASYGEFSKREAAELRMLCGKLVKYSRSKVLSTQLTALEEITTLSIEDPVIRRVLRSCDASYFVPKYKEPDVLLATAKAFGSVVENETHHLWSSLLLHSESEILLSSDNEKRKTSFEKSIINSLRNPQTSYIAARYLSQFCQLQSASRSEPLVALDLMRIYFEVVSNLTGNIEWSTFNMCNRSLKHSTALPSFGEALFDSTIRDVAGAVILNARSLPDFFSAYFKLPRARTQTGSEGDSSSYSLLPVDHKDLIDWSKGCYATICVKFLTAVSGSEDIDVQLSFLRNLDFATRKQLQETTLGNEMFIAYYHLEHLASGLQSMLNNWDKLVSAATILAGYLDVYNSPEDQALATFFAVEFASYGRYHNLAINLGARHLSKPLLCTTDYAKPMFDLAMKRRSARSKMPSPLRVTVNGVCRYVMSTEHPDISRKDDFGKLFHDLPKQSFLVDLMVKSTDIFVTTLRVNRKTGPFRITGHYPLLAGFDEAGMALYIAEAEHPKSVVHYTCVADGATTASFSDASGATRVCDEFSVLVLRYDPSSLHSCVSSTLGNTIDSTGPLAWRRYWPERDPVIPGLVADDDLKRHRLADIVKHRSKYRLRSRLKHFDRVLSRSMNPVGKVDLGDKMWMILES